MSLKKDLARRRAKAKSRVRKKISGSSDIPRLSVYRSGSHIYAQIINDENHATLTSASSLDKEIRSQLKDDMNKSETAKTVGKALAERAKEAGIKSVVFDRNGYIYTGRVKALADAAREAGLEF